jgi:hypothetical protein
MMKMFVISAIVAGSLLMLAAGSEPLPVDYNGVRALVAQIMASLRS